MAENVTFRFAEREDVPLILEFVKALAEYEKMPDAVCATEEDLEEWLFDKERAEVSYPGRRRGLRCFSRALRLIRERAASIWTICM